MATDCLCVCFGVYVCVYSYMHKCDRLVHSYCFYPNDTFADSVVVMYRIPVFEIRPEPNSTG